MTSLLQILLLLLDVVWFIVIAHIIMSWLINFNVLNRNQPLVWQIWTGLERLLEPIYRPIRNVLPNLGGLDLSPMIADHRALRVAGDPNEQRRTVPLTQSSLKPRASRIGGQPGSAPHIRCSPGSRPQARR